MHFTIYLYNAILSHLEYIHVVLKLDCLVNIVQSKILPLTFPKTQEKDPLKRSKLISKKNHTKPTAFYFWFDSLMLLQLVGSASGMINPDLGPVLDPN